MKKAVRSCNTLALWTDPRWESLIFEGMSPSPGKRQDSAKTTGMSRPRAGSGLGVAGRDSQGETGPSSAARDSLLPAGPTLGLLRLLTAAGYQEEVSVQKLGKQSMGTFTERQRFRTGNCSLLWPCPHAGFAVQ